MWCFWYNFAVQGKMVSEDLETALQHCSHLLYGYAGVSSIDYKMISLNQHFDTTKGNSNYKSITSFRARYPDLKILLSVGGGADTEVPEKYNKLVCFIFIYIVKLFYLTY